MSELPRSTYNIWNQWAVLWLLPGSPQWEVPSLLPPAPAVLTPFPLFASLYNPLLPQSKLSPSRAAPWPSLVSCRQTGIHMEPLSDTGKPRERGCSVEVILRRAAAWRGRKGQEGRRWGLTVSLLPYFVRGPREEIHFRGLPLRISSLYIINMWKFAVSCVALSHYFLIIYVYMYTFQLQKQNESLFAYLEITFLNNSKLLNP